MRFSEFIQYLFFKKADQNQNKLKLHNLQSYKTKMKKVILVILLLIFISNSLHLQFHLNQDSYLNQYQRKHKQFTQKLSQLRHDIDRSSNSFQNQQSTDQKIKKLESSIIRQKKLLYQASLTLIPPINQVSWKCPNLQGTTLKQLKGLAADLDDETNELNGLVTDLKGKQTPQSIANAGAAVLYADAIKKSLDIPIDYYNPDNVKTGYISDLSGDKWIPGGLSNQQIQKSIQDVKDKNDVIKTCPSSTPYFNGETCISCSSGKIFNLQTNTCLSCSDFDSQNKLCLSSSGNYDGTNVDAGQSRLILLPGVSPQLIKEKIKNPCPSDQPFYAKKYCVDCSGSTPLFNYQEQQCTNCPDGFIYQPQQFKCLKKPIYGTNYPLARDHIVIPENTTLTNLEKQQKKLSETENLILCPKQKPFFNTYIQECINCQEGTYFIMEKNICQKCKDGLIYYHPSQRCVSSPIYSNLANRNWTSINPKQTKIDIEQTKKLQFSKQCPLVKPFFNGIQCIQCPVNQIFSFDTQECTKCQKGTFFSPNIHQCVKPQGDYQTNPKTAPNLLYGGVSKAQWSNRYYKNIQQNPNIADCPSQRPYFQGVICIQCPSEHPYFNMKYRMCQSCQQGSQYDSDLRQCLNPGGKILDQTPNLEKMAAGVFT